MNPRFENTVVDGIGNLTELEGIHIEELRKRLPPERYAAYTSTSPAPPGWPSEVKRVSECLDVGKCLVPVPEGWPKAKPSVPPDMEHLAATEGKIVKTDAWDMNLDGTGWRRFYGFVLTTYLEKLGEEPAFVYERLHKSSGTAYVPKVSMLLSLDGHIMGASSRWCEIVIDDRLRHDAATPNEDDASETE